MLDKLRKDEQTKEAIFESENVTLNFPEQDGEEFIVYAENSKGDVVKVRFKSPVDDAEFYVKNKCDLQQDRSTPMYWACKLYPKAVDVQDHSFSHIATYDSLKKTLTSVRDGVQEYLGVELGLQPPHKVFTVYRSPETISAIAGQLKELAIIEDHIDVDESTAGKEIGLIDSTEVIEAVDSTTDTTLMLSHKANFSDKILKIIDSGKKFFSLGYKAKMSKHDKYDFEQTEIVPVHLAIVDAARGGAGLKFHDRGNTMDKPWLDADGKITMQGLADLLKSLSENLQNIDMGEAKKIGQLLQKATTIAEGGEPVEETQEEAPVEEVVVEDATPEEEEEKKMTDSKAFKDAVAVAAEAMAKEHIEVVTKAKTLLPETYDFADKSPSEIMGDCLQEHGYDEEFKDSELSLAFKMLKPVDKFSNFGDRAANTKINGKKEL